jgi:hypothetical protein
VTAPGAVTRACAAVLVVQVLALWAAAWATQPAASVCDADELARTPSARGYAVVRLQGYLHP